MMNCILALDIGGTYLKACLADLQGALLPDSFDMERVLENAELSAIKRAYQKLFFRMKENAEKNGRKIAAVSADAPGPFDYARGVSLMKHKYTALYGVELTPWFTEVFGNLPVFFLHDSASFMFGASSEMPEIKNAAGVMLGTGLGFALMKDGEVQRQPSGSPLVSIYNRPYRGKTAEEYVSARGILNRYNALSKKPEDSTLSVANRAFKGDETALRVFRETGGMLAEIIAPILSEYGTEALFLGGQIAKSFELMRDPLLKGLSEVKTLRLVKPVDDLDFVHMKGAVSDAISRLHYPMKLEAVLKDILWGGTALSEHFHKPTGKIAEAWALSVHQEGVNRIENGALRGRLLDELPGIDDPFPVMIKLIDACDKLSIQVHPVKTEMWVVLDAKPGSTLVYGLKNPFDENAFRAALENDTVEELLNFVPVHPGDVFFIPQGMVHAIGAGILIAEIQENSNVTYRVYDYKRLKDGKPRALHVEEAMKTIRDFSPEDIEKARFTGLSKSDGCLADCPLFRVEKHEIRGSKRLLLRDRTFTALLCTEGAGAIGDEPVVKGDCYYLPEGMKEVRLTGEMTLLVTEKGAGA